MAFEYLRQESCSSDSEARARKRLPESATIILVIGSLTNKISEREKRTDSKSATVAAACSIGCCRPFTSPDLQVKIVLKCQHELGTTIWPDPMSSTSTHMIIIAGLNTLKIPFKPGVACSAIVTAVII
jgi:hypothetical protein